MGNGGKFKLGYMLIFYDRIFVSQVAIVVLSFMNDSNWTKESKGRGASEGFLAIRKPCSQYVLGDPHYLYEIP